MLRKNSGTTIKLPRITIQHGEGLVDSLEQSIKSQRDEDKQNTAEQAADNAEAEEQLVSSPAAKASAILSVGAWRQSEVAQLLGVCRATVYALCARGSPSPCPCLERLCACARTTCVS
jgi:DNA-directed RNA polymerase specialized sigma24 family protein